MQYQGPPDDVRVALATRMPLIDTDFTAAWNRFRANHRNVSRHYATPHDLMTNDDATPDAIRYWRSCWSRIEYRIWKKHEQAAYRSLPTPVACPNPACRHADCLRTDRYCPICGSPHAENITRGGLH